ncbi:hypothetical protein CIHG_05230 [Coccidioides immitis H538.4]|uniref:Uncharacterized protein n=2 Tax=Coccidioides TaxID=5500 RepID=A0A0J8RQR6_COCIT|nr:hypothetical protein CPAG_07954 [Coccidioides posadasii RMSCC 3488]KMU87435.1 hypothetical protein CIHG_05230 [Coccidioides immitis H538.4]
MPVLLSHKRVLLDAGLARVPRNQSKETAELHIYFPGSEI